MSLGQAEGVIRAILMILNRIFKRFGGIWDVFCGFSLQFWRHAGSRSGHSGPGRAIVVSISGLVVCFMLGQ